MRAPDWHNISCPLPDILPYFHDCPNGKIRKTHGGFIAHHHPTIIPEGAVTRRAGRSLNSGNLWQRNYYEHILRNQADYERVASYIWENPANWIQDNENPLIYFYNGEKIT